jgi:hypothetical protein
MDFEDPELKIFMYESIGFQFVSVCKDRLPAGSSTDVFVA